jgi:hypothetical protein
MIGEMSEQIASDTLAAAPSRRRRPRWKTLVVTGVFVLLFASSVADGADLFFAITSATFWSALVALVWELSARALARRRG